MVAGSRIASVEEIPADSTVLFTVADLETGEEREAILVRVEAGGDEHGDDDGHDVRSDTGGHDVESDGDAGSTDDEDDIRAWANYCRHFTHIRLDTGSGATIRDGELVCTNHGAMFAADTGLCTFGPCEGAVLEAIGVTVADGAVYLTDDDHELVGVGPTEPDDFDLSSSSNVEF